MPSRPSLDNSRIVNILGTMGHSVKFASTMDSDLLEALREHAERSGRSISSILENAVAEHLDRVRVRPAFRAAVDQVLEEHDELLARLAR